jgi:hypothetical protein
MALLSQVGSTIETAVEIVPGVVPESHSLRMHSETFRLWNHPSRHRKERDDAALLTQEGNSPSVQIVYGNTILPRLQPRAYRLEVVTHFGADPVFWRRTRFNCAA